MWSALAGSILLWGLDPRRLHRGDGVALPATGRRSTGRLGDARACAVAAFFFGLMAGPADPFTTVSGHGSRQRARARTCCCRTTRSSPSTRRSCTSGSSGSPSRSRSPSPPSSPGGSRETWQAPTRRWTLFAWAFLTVGILLGAWWSYQVLGWGGFWAWDPVENASLLPWLCATAYLHSSMVQERRGLMRVWNLSLVIATFCLTILGHVPHPLGGRSVGARLLRLRHRPAAARLLRRRAGAGVGPDRVAWGPAALTRRDRLAAQPRRAPSSSTTSSSWPSPSSSCSAPCSLFSTRRSGASRSPWASPYFDTMTLPLGLGSARSSWRRPRSAVAQDDGGDLARPADDPGLCRALVVVVSCVRRRRAGSRPACRVRPRRVRGGRQRPPARALGPRRRAGSGSGAWRGLVGPCERGHGRAPRGGGDRGRTGGGHLVRPPGRGDAAAGQVATSRRTHASSSSASPRSARPPRTATRGPRDGRRRRAVAARREPVRAEHRGGRARRPSTRASRTTST